uniref:EF-hand domain-containing protein n=1 Tax=Spongospora subterranea TaxID=70186 RepID=A0A0H5RSX6_9EUKA|eukprot:CRZ11824.1 hypothetical protein [Spongospora subterranea]
MQIFPPEDVLEQLDLVPLSMLIFFYAYILYSASCTLSKGSSLLLSLYGPGMVGGFVIPILGAIPDGMIILISGLGQGSVKVIQKQVAVGVGTLAGSTIMLITIPWAIGVFLGRRDIDASGQAASKIVDGVVRPLYTKFTWMSTGVTAFPEIPFLSNTMMATVLLYLIIQIPALYFRQDAQASAEERIYAMIGFVGAAASFITYSAVQLKSTEGNEVVKQFQMSSQRQRWEKTLSKQFPPGKSMKIIFKNFDLDGDDFIDRFELTKCLQSLGLKADEQEVTTILKEMDLGDDNGEGAKDGRISFLEFEKFFSCLITPPSKRAHHRSNTQAGPAIAAFADDSLNMHAVLLDVPEVEDEWDDDCDEAELEFSALSSSEIRRKAFRTLLLATVLVAVFSFPMVTTINVFATNLGISPFYVSFIVTPLASNASEIISALQFAAKRNSKGVSLMFGSLYGAANMNNTFGLSIFLGLVALRGLQWKFTAEVFVIIVVTMCVGFQGRQRTVRMWQAALVASLYPFSVAAIWGLKRLGLDQGYKEPI